MVFIAAKRVNPRITSTSPTICRARAFNSTQGVFPMTRDEAISTQMRVYLHQGVSSCSAEVIAADQIDSWVALGVLKLDEPKTVEQRTTEIIERHATAAQSAHIVAGLKKAGLL
jgi:hypothetical protein